jgi:hypothetical protein
LLSLKSYILDFVNLTLWNRFLLEKLIVAQLGKKLPVFYGTRRFITVFACGRLPPLYWTRRIPSTPSRLSFLRLILYYPIIYARVTEWPLKPSGFPNSTHISHLHSR